MSKILFVILSLSLMLQANKGLINYAKVYDDKGKFILEYKNSYALLIGIGTYTYWGALPLIDDELDKIEKALTDNGFKVIRVNHPTGSELRKSIEDFIRDYGYIVDNRLLLYYTGHGYNDKNNMGYIVGKDAQKPDVNEELFYKNSLAMTSMKAFAVQIKSKHVLFVFDSCFAGTIFSKGDHKYIKENLQRPIRYFITAGTDDEVVPSRSLFTDAFVDGISGDADKGRDGYVTARELGHYISKQVINKTTGDQIQTHPQQGPIGMRHLSQGEFIFFTPKSKKKTAHKSLELWNNVQEQNVCSGYKFFCQTYKTSKKSPYFNQAKKKILSTCKKYLPVIGTTPASLEHNKNSDGWDKSIFSGKRSYTKHTNSSVKDNLTDLIWQKSDDGVKRDYSGAIAYCKGLSLDNFSNWRLPTYNELYYLADRNNYNLAIDTKYFNAKSDDWYWASTKCSWNSSRAWIVYFGNGSDNSIDLSSKNYVRCVR